MAKLIFYILFFLLCFTNFLLPSESSPVRAAPQSQRVAGVFLLTEGGKYTFNFTAARAACLFLNITMATIDHMERAVQHGLETCKYGWTADGVAVIPRLNSDEKCGKGKTGVVKWFAAQDHNFGVFCFNASDLEGTSTTAPQTFTSSTTLTAPTFTPATPPVTTTTTMSPPSTRRPTTRNPKQTPSTSAFGPLIKTTRSTTVSSSSSSSHSPTTLPHLINAEPAVSTRVFSTSAHTSNFWELPVPESSFKPSLGAVPTAIIVLSVVLLLLAAAAATWYYKLNSATCWSQRQPKDDTETEMWKNTDSEMDLHGLCGAEEDDDEEESHRKYFSDITLCVNPNVKADTLECLHDN
ncbi:lymphatic vessel endothelial hyaluronic receptor 1b [Parambassis ranga]|uniref:Lymphatic vessel endothelial hyaluronic receptor 1b n=1 Tax=Parambassis ranga TaxID=210632 RepID=A0A6P7KA81_9TELE|nr:lymphatic vessel endothelial hyaluronic acid receptor 1-like [Parambassis ranga]